MTALAVPSKFKDCMDKNLLTAHWWLITHGLPEYFEVEDLENGQYRVCVKHEDGSKIFQGRLTHWEAESLDVIPSYYKRFWFLDRENQSDLLGFILRFQLKVAIRSEDFKYLVQGPSVNFSRANVDDLTNLDMRSHEFSEHKWNFSGSILMMTCYELEARKVKSI